MAKDPAFLFYPGDASEDTQHMNRLERGAYFDILKAQKKFDKFTIEQIKKFLGSDFEKCWPALELVLKKENEFYYIEWVAEKIAARKNFSESRRKNRAKKEYIKTHVEDIIKTSSSYDHHMVNGNGDGIENVKVEGPGEGNFSIADETDVDLLLEKVFRDPDYRMMCEQAGYPPAKLERWMSAFNRFLIFKGKHHCREDLWRLGFPGWMAYHSYQNGEDPDSYNPVIWARKKKEDYDKIFANGNQYGKTKQNHSHRAVITGAAPGAGSI